MGWWWSGGSSLTGSSLQRVNRDELVDLAESMGIACSDSMVKAELAWAEKQMSMIGVRQKGKRERGNEKEEGGGGA